ncbi:MULTISPECIES: ComEC/Rec2 family competence protein [Cyanophyceae]|uniref:ComEC/Rec2 family competence protein n=1 Tax=Cyanophyceae TaxID=3028117 RepID=UPI00232EF076|nr:MULTISPECIES: ComEC/Rec2 family competence protein [Cyanophyceae]MDB9354817.1 ComEC/Rec2 family competence protein [Nodularia spumigena CS-587/03]MDB9340260.1 ComEC/Rec2 family competence protein [Nodularia spumigena CS-589/07]MDB9399717.1 ComEC/Rec2 family competence protein [Microcystis aeruginosa CS-567/02-A1]MDB9501136.1 ComEC/Rec2 family competence protein [Nodularia spumigena CS-336/02]MDB9532496.1 ComEC/Rec2 family competence protein [Nodularia spumigena CS-1038]
MIQTSGVFICLGFILGLLLTGVSGGGFWVLGFGVVGAVLFGRRRLGRFAQKSENAGGKTEGVPNIWQNAPHPRIWLVAGLVGLLATFYFQWRSPQPNKNDISTFIASENNGNQQQLVIVRGEVASNPRLTRSQRGQFVLSATQLDEVKNETGPVAVSKGVTGKLYVTVPILQATGLYPGQQIAVTGVLYKPRTASNPGAFDFQKFLQQQGIFAGLTGRQINALDQYDERKWGWWQVRQRIVRSQVRWLGVPAGPLVSAMVLGSRAVDLPYDMRDLFVKAGLAHTLAASGFHVSLVLGLILQLTRRASKGTQFTFGCLGLIIFLSLTGFQPSVLRAVIMGFAALVGLLLNRKVKQFGSLLLAVTILLLINPLWIWDLGFELSFLATLGLIVTVPALVKRLDWLPLAIASLIAVPLAATIWTLPVQLYVFGVMPAYGVLLNIISTPLIATISIGGIISAIAALVWPAGGSALAGVLYFPTDWLIKLVEAFSNLPGNSLSLGSIATWQLLGIYAVDILVWLVRWWQKRQLLAGLMAISLVLIPSWYYTNTLFRITVLAAGTEPVVVIQDRGKVTLINSGDQGTGRFTILPFLQQQGVNQIDWAIASNFKYQNSNAWLELLQTLPIKNFYEYSPNLKSTTAIQAIQQEVQKQQGSYQPLAPGQTVNTGSVVAQLINEQLPVLQFQIQGQNWLLVGNVKPQEVEQLYKAGSLLRPQVLWCSPQSLRELVQMFEPQVAIASYGNVDSKTLSELSKNQTQLFFTRDDGAIQWTPNGQFEAFVQATENKSSIF